MSIRSIYTKKHLLTLILLVLLSLAIGTSPGIAGEANLTERATIFLHSHKRVVLHAKMPATSTPGYTTSSSSAQLESSLAVIKQYSFSASDPGAFDEFGSIVAIDGNIGVVGARNDDINPGNGIIYNAGAIYVFIFNGEYWYQEAKLTPRDAASNDAFGSAVAVSGNRIIVGAPGVDLDDGDIDDAGAAYIFTRENNTWEQQAKLVASDPAQEDLFGAAVAIDGDIAVVGAEGKDLSYLLDTGAAYIFRRRGSSWGQKAKLLPLDPNLGDFFGISVAVSGETVVVGATELNPYGPTRGGKAYVFTDVGGTWLQNAKLHAEDDRNGDAFGRSVSISNGWIVVGAPFKDPEVEDRFITKAGAAYVFVPFGAGWKQEAVLIADDASPFDQFGRSVNIYGKTIAVGAEGKTQAGNARAGAAYIFRKKPGAWEQQTKAVTDPAFKDDVFGGSVAIWRNWVFVGASGRDPYALSRAGEAFVIELGDVQLPATGFAPGHITTLPAQPVEKTYQDLGELWLEISSLNVQIPIIGIPKETNGWDVRWLENQAGYLAETAFPTWAGNTGIVGHKTLSDGSPGPFANLTALQWGDQVVIHAWGQRYIYEIRQNTLVQPTDMDVLAHEELDWVTLITCQGYDETSGEYHWRRVVRAVLISIESE